MNTQIDLARVADLRYIEHLCRRDNDALGFVPLSTYHDIVTPGGQRQRWRYSQLLVTRDNADCTGYCYWSWHGDLAQIFQIVIQEDARRWERATAVLTQVEQAAQRHGCLGVRCRVACDLQSNLFWRASGYHPVQQVLSTHYNRGRSKARRPLYIYLKHWMPLFAARATAGGTP